CKKIPIGINGILLRGCILRNTKWVIGLALYTGSDTKLMLNSGATPSKRSKIDRQLNPQILLNFLILFALCLICGNIVPIALYISVDIAKTFQSFMISMDEEMYDAESDQHVLPRSWNLCDDLGQIEYIFSDKTGTLTCNVMEFRKCSINGVMYGGNYVTEAMMGAAMRSGAPSTVPINLNSSLNNPTSTTTTTSSDVGTSSSIEHPTSPNANPDSTPHDSKDPKKKDPKTLRLEAERQMREIMSQNFNMKYIPPYNPSKPLSFVDPLLHQHIAEGGEQCWAIVEFFTLLAVCHTVLVENEGDEEGGGAGSPAVPAYNSEPIADFISPVTPASPETATATGPRPSTSKRSLLKYKAQSPDEAALVAAAKDNGFAFLRRADTQITVDIMGELKTFTILHVLEFNSDRKRMSVIVRRPEGDVVLLVKGADSVIYERLRADTEVELKEITSMHLGMFANDGLRTLCLAYRLVPDEVYLPWAEKYRAAQSLLKDREKAVDAVAELIERDLILMGTTAIEDKLQDGVPDSIATLAKAGIKIWVLTGDKMETAINIGFACNLLQRNMILIVVKSGSMEETESQLVAALE
ncbi:hypothetical protein HK102_008743, partial [Quaeritorhiza haematococci]